VLVGAIDTVVVVENDTQVWNASNGVWWFGCLVINCLKHKFCVFGTFIYQNDFLIVIPRSWVRELVGKSNGHLVRTIVVSKSFLDSLVFFVGCGN
jgi:hypothetical protein